VFLGRRLPGLLRDAGLVDVEVMAHTRTWRAGDPYQDLLLRFVQIYRERIVDRGALSERQLDEYVAELTAHLANPETITLYATLFQAWGRRPRQRSGARRRR
jgi:hypothetical protein